MAKYRAAYCEEIIEHLAAGNTIKSFAGKIGVTDRTIRNWSDAHPEFEAAKEVGEGRREAWLLALGHRIAAGQLVREEPVLLPDGRPLLDAAGRMVTRKVHTPGNAAAWIFMMRNMCKWRNVDAIEHSGPEEGAPIKVESKVEVAPPLTAAERDRRYEELMKKAMRAAAKAKG